MINCNIISSFLNYRIHVSFHISSISAQKLTCILHTIRFSHMEELDNISVGFVSHGAAHKIELFSHTVHLQQAPVEIFFLTWTHQEECTCKKNKKNPHRKTLSLPSFFSRGCRVYTSDLFWKYLRVIIPFYVSLTGFYTVLLGMEIKLL